MEGAPAGAGGEGIREVVCEGEGGAVVGGQGTGFVQTAEFGFIGDCGFDEGVVYDEDLALALEFQCVVWQRGGCWCGEDGSCESEEERGDLVEAHGWGCVVIW